MAQCYCAGSLINDSDMKSLICRQISVSTAVREKNSAVAAPQACAEEGVLVEYKKDQKSGLALITERDGKRNWKAIDIRHSSICILIKESWQLQGSDQKCLSSAFIGTCHFQRKEPPAPERFCLKAVFCFSFSSELAHNGIDICIIH